MASNLYIYLDWLLLIVMVLSFCEQLFYKKINFYGILSLLALATYIAIHSLNEEINIFILLLFFGGVFLIILEMFIPGGILGVIGVIVLITDIVIVNDKTYNIAFIIIVSLFLGVILYTINKKVFKKKLLFLGNFVLDDKLSSEEGYLAKESEVELIGEILTAYTDLRPAGVALFNEKKIDVVTEGDFIEKNNKVKVVKVEGMRVVVRKI